VVSKHEYMDRRVVTEAPLPMAWKLIRSQAPGPRGEPFGGKASKSMVTVVKDVDCIEVLIEERGMVGDWAPSLVPWKYNCNALGSTAMSNLSTTEDEITLGDFNDNAAHAPDTAEILDLPTLRSVAAQSMVVFHPQFCHPSLRALSTYIFSSDFTTNAERRATHAACSATDSIEVRNRYRETKECCHKIGVLFDDEDTV
jgi:hypothetical protein